MASSNKSGTSSNNNFSNGAGGTGRGDGTSGGSGGGCGGGCGGGAGGGGSHGARRGCSRPVDGDNKACPASSAAAAIDLSLDSDTDDEGGGQAIRVRGGNRLPTSVESAQEGAATAGGAAVRGGRGLSPVAMAAASAFPGDASTASAADEGAQAWRGGRGEWAQGALPPLLGCPFYTGKALARQSQLVLMPYNYILVSEGDETIFTWWRNR